jgi:hypothetical protein
MGVTLLSASDSTTTLTSSGQGSVMLTYGGGDEEIAPTDADKHFTLGVTGETDITINHGLNKVPAVTITDTAGEQVEADVTHLDTNRTKLDFSAAFTGVIVFN